MQVRLKPTILAGKLIAGYVPQVTFPLDSPTRPVLSFEHPERTDMREKSLLVTGWACLLALSFPMVGCVRATGPVTFVEASPETQSAITKRVALAPDSARQLASVRTAMVSHLECEDSRIARAVKDVIVGYVVSAGVVATDASDADIIISGVLTFSDDVYSQESAYANSSEAGSASSSRAGRYLSGITLSMRVGENIVGTISGTQARTQEWNPDPPEVLAQWVGGVIAEVLSRGRTN